MVLQSAGSGSPMAKVGAAAYRLLFTVLNSFKMHIMKDSLSRNCFYSLECLIHMNTLNAKTNIFIFINLRYLRLMLQKNKENNKKIKKVCDNFHHNFKNIPCYVTIEVSLKNFYLALYNSYQDCPIDFHIRHSVPFHDHEIVPPTISWPVRYASVLSHNIHMNPMCVAQSAACAVQ